MSSKSRGRHRFAQDAAEREAAADEKKSRWAEMAEAFDGANTKAGVRKLVGLALKDREAQLAPPEPPKADPRGPRLQPGDYVRAPTQYEQSILSGLAQKTGWSGRQPIDPYGGTVEPWRIERRRRRNKAARATRRAQRRAARR